MDEELGGMVATKGCGRWLNVWMETSGNWYPWGPVLGPKPVTIRVTVSDRCHQRPFDVLLHNVLIPQLGGVDAWTVAPRGLWSMAPYPDGDQCQLVFLRGPYWDQCWSINGRCHCRPVDVVHHNVLRSKLERGVMDEELSGWWQPGLGVKDSALDKEEEFEARQGQI